MDFDGPVPAGAFKFYVNAQKEIAGLLFGCPCGCGQMMSVPFRDESGKRPSWEWDGNQVSPSLSPSILIKQLDSSAQQIGEHWHGYLTDGDFRSC